MRHRFCKFDIHSRDRVDKEHKESVLCRHHRDIVFDEIHLGQSTRDNYTSDQYISLLLLLFSSYPLISSANRFILSSMISFSLLFTTNSFGGTGAWTLLSLFLRLSASSSTSER